jgi:hypothetical protein
MVMVIPTYRFWFQGYPREHTPEVRSFLSFLSLLGLVLFFLSRSEFSLSFPIWEFCPKPP